MTVFLSIGVAGIVLLLLAIVVGDHFDGIFDALGGGDWFTGAGLAGFLGAFGFAGAFALSTTNNSTAAVIVGLLTGLVVGAAVAWVTIKLRHSGEGVTPRTDELIGQQGTVVTDIPSDGYGEVGLVNRGHITKVNARAPEPIPAGTPVTVTDILSATSVKVHTTYR